LNNASPAEPANASYSRDLITTLRDREVDALGQRLADETSMPFTKATDGVQVSGIYSRRFALGSGRFAMVDNGLGFQLVPGRRRSRSILSGTRRA
jgi:hypothetical protein